MAAKQLVLRELARRDIEEAIDFYRADGSEALALRYVGALEATLVGIASQPAAGSPRYGQELDLPGLRSRLLPRFPYLVFYVETAEAIDVWRVLHAQRDIPAWLGAGQP